MKHIENKMSDVNSTISIITLNVNELSNSIKCREYWIGFLKIHQKPCAVYWKQSLDLKI